MLCEVTSVDQVHKKKKPDKWEPLFEYSSRPDLDIHEVECSEYNYQTKALRKEKEIGESGIVAHHEKTKTNGRQEKEPVHDYKKNLDDLEKCFEQHKKQEEMELKECKERCAKNKTKQEEEMNVFSAKHVQNMQEMKDEFEKQINQAEHNFKKKVTKTENAGMADESEDYEYKHYCLSYIGQVCLNLQANMYHIVLPDQFAENWLYKVKDIERDIEDTQLLGEQERKAASKRWGALKGHLDWDPSLEKTLKMLQKDGRSSLDPTESLTAEKAKRAAEELNKQGRLRGRTSYEKVTKIIEMWRISTDLLQSNTMKKSSNV